jgi:hypothetical protein
LKPASTKSSQDPTSINKKLGTVAHAYHPNYVGSISWRIVVQASPSIKGERLYSKNNESKKGWGHSSNGSVPCLSSKYRALSSNSSTILTPTHAKRMNKSCNNKNKKRI